jgi:hypothetical protein
MDNTTNLINIGTFGSFKDSQKFSIITDDIMDEESSNNMITLKKSSNSCEKDYSSISSISLNLQFQNFLKKYEKINEESIRMNFKYILNAFTILLENSIYNYFENISVIKNEVNNYNFKLNLKGRFKEITIRKEKDKEFNYFDLLYKAYLKLKKMVYCASETLCEINDIIYDLTGLPILEFSLKNKIVVNKLNTYLKSLIENPKYIVLLVSNEEELENLQICFQVISFFETSQKNKLKDYHLFEGQTSSSLLILDENSDKNKYTEIETQKILLKLRKFNGMINLKTLYDYNYLLEDRNNDITEFKELYPLGKANYTYISICEVYSLFSKMLLIEKNKYEKQFNGKFIKTARYDGVIEYKSRWIYSFNVTSENFEVTIGIHQSIPNSFSIIPPYLYTGLVILKSNTPIINFVDYLPLKESRQNFIKVKLSKGSYVVIPM